MARGFMSRGFVNGVWSRQKAGAPQACGPGELLLWVRKEGVWGEGKEKRVRERGDTRGQG
ncbi:hypothetical protein HaLaN_20694 [Haematococcus lacustris]|uniref:Uncharacterized protein n=1 Tax=Haematococcus lacustris TaxID=44745 RepID=A0A699ZLM1_HAELA|nr:hypothetical protein HaLaN_20694 [Haematococcus lacustris]